MNHIVNFCCNDRKGFESLPFSDITFQLGPFYLLLTIYNNKCLFYKGTNTCPIMLGPLMLCLLKDQCTHDTLFQKISAAFPGLACCLQGYASDCEKPSGILLATFKDTHPIVKKPSGIPWHLPSHAVLSTSV